METEQLQNFNERLSQWVANQGFWFQVRYSMSGSGMKGRAMFHLLRLGFRLLIFLLVVALGAWVYLVKRTDSERFTERMQDKLKAGLSATEMEMRGFDRVAGPAGDQPPGRRGRGRDVFHRAGGAQHPLQDGPAGRIGGKSGNRGSSPSPGSILDLRAGTDDAESAHKLAEALFQRPEKIEVNAFEVAERDLALGIFRAHPGRDRIQRAEDAADPDRLADELQGWRFPPELAARTSDRESRGALRAEGHCVRDGGVEAGRRHRGFFRTEGYRVASARR